MLTVFGTVYGYPRITANGLDPDWTSGDVAWSGETLLTSIILPCSGRSS